MRAHLLAVAVGMSLASASADAQDQVGGFELEQLRYNSSGRGGLLVGGSDLLEKGDLRMSLLFGYQNNPFKYFEDGALRSKLVEHRWTALLGAAYSPTRWLELSATLPAVLYQNGETLTSDRGEVVFPPVSRRRSMGTAWLQARFGILTESEGHPLDLGLGVGVGLPTGRSDNLTREKSVPLMPNLGTGRSIGSALRLSAEFAALVRSSELTLLGGLDARAVERLGNRFEAAAGASSLGQGLRAELSARAFFPLTSVPTSVELMAGLRYPLANFELFAIGGPGFGNSPGTPAYRALLGVAYGGGPREPRRDRDGDGVLDRSDACPEVPAPGTRTGCPSSDADGDGLTDDVDTCPSAPGPRERRGCPVVDSDGDGLEDEKDACADRPGTPELRGCPDADRDGVVDSADPCPTEPGPVENGGCPQKAQRVQLKGDRIELGGQVYFDSAKATLQPRSFELLREIAALMVKHSELKQFAIHGHTDSQGPTEVNQKLSDARALAVRDFLITEGVEQSRLVAQGFGESRPLTHNDTPQGREKNRRVEILVLTPQRPESSPSMVP